MTHLPTSLNRRRVTNSQEAKEAVADLKRLGVDFIKVHDHTPREVFFAIAQEAPRLGLPFAGHVPAGVKVEEAADAGIRSIEHLSNYDVFGECLVNDRYTTVGCRRLFEKLAANADDGVLSNNSRRVRGPTDRTCRVCQRLPP